jgi:hypothetical protein
MRAGERFVRTALAVAVLGAATAARADVEFEVAMESMQTYATQATEAKSLLVTRYTNGLANFETTIQQASAQEAKADVVGAILKVAWKTTRDAAFKAVKEATGADVKPLADLYEEIHKEIDRAAAANTSHQAGVWIRNLRSSIVTAGTKETSGALLDRLKMHYASLSTDDRLDWITNLQAETEALKAFAAPEVTEVEAGFYEAWINGHFNHCSLEGGDGFLKITFASDDSLEEAVVKAPLGDKIEGGLDGVHTGSLMNLAVNKQVCSYGDLVVGTGWRCYCFDDRNAVRMASSLVDGDALLERAKKVGSFKRN